MAVAGAASGDHPRLAGRQLRRAGRRLDVAAPAVEAVDTTGAGDVFAGVLAASWLDGRPTARAAPGVRGGCAGRPWYRVPGDCAPYAEAIEDAVAATEDRTVVVIVGSHDRSTNNAATARRRLARHAVSEVRRGRVRSASCTLDRPEARNAMTPAMYFGIRYAVGLVEADDDLAGLLITGTGDVFAPGGDLGGGDGSDNWLTFGAALNMDVTPFETLRQSVKPVVSAVNGLCQGGGLQIAICSDMAVVSDRATFRVPELYRGIADTYYSQMLARLIGPVRTRDLMFTGRVLSAQEAVDWGMVARVVPHDELLDAAREVLTQCCRTAPRARGVVKSSIDNYLGLYDRIGMKASYSGDEARQGFIAFKERRSPDWVHPDLRADGRL